MERTNICDKCVYTTPRGLCSGKTPLHRKEHYLPAGLGNFKQDVRLSNYICEECQVRFSRYEEVFLRNSPEAFFRNFLGVRGRRSHVAKNIFVDPTAGLRPLTVKGLHPSVDHKVLWEVGPKGQLFLMHQLVFKKGDGDLEWVPLRSGCIAQDIAKLGDNWKTWQLLFCYSGDALESELKSTLGLALENCVDSPLGLNEGMQVEIEMLAMHSLPYRQALCKIGFHFVLAHFHFTGFEAEFDDLKRFIYLGTGENRAEIVEEPLLPQLIREEVYFRDWCHILTAEYNPDQFIARMQFFAGPKLKPFTWRIHLGNSPSPFLAGEAKGFRYYYYEAVDASGYIGSVEPLGLGPRLLAKRSS